jgi:plasmid stability protein
MNHNKYKEWMLLLIYDELESDEQEELKTHLDKCDECKEEYEKLKKFRQVISPSMLKSVDESALLESRQDLRNAIRIERRKKSVWRKTVELIERFTLPGYRVAFGGLAIFAVGLFIGYLFFYPRQIDSQSKIISEGTELVKGEMRISGLKFIDAGVSDGEVEFTFEEIIPIRMRGNVNDARIQKILTSALLNEQNPGTRLKAVNAMAAQQTNNTDKETKEALINALKNDENPGVRKEALQVLKKLNFDNEIRDAFLYVLKSDKNSGLRIAAINSIAEAKDIEKFSDANTVNALRERIQTDDNSYIRMRAKTILMEVKK